MHSPIDLANVTVCLYPFPHFSVPCAMAKSFTEPLLDWFENDAPWRLKVGSFYEQHEFSLLDEPVPAELACVCDADMLSYLRSRLGELLQTPLVDPVGVAAHQLVAGQQIRIHNDYLPGKETHRLLLQLSRSWSEEHGGLLLLYENPESDDAVRIIQPTNRSAFGFAISPTSHHAVSAVHKGQRFTLVYSFYSRSPSPVT